MAGVTYSLWTDRSLLVAIQQIVKKHDLRFENDPNRWPGDRVLVMITTDDVHAMNRASQEIEKLRPVLPPKPRTWKQRLADWWRQA